MMTDNTRRTKHPVFYWWDRRESTPKGPFVTEHAAQEDALSNADPAFDVLIFQEISYAMPATRVRNWSQA